MDRKRVVVTGMGMVTPLGQSVERNWSRLLKGHSAISEASELPEEYQTRIWGKIQSLDFGDVLSPKEVKRIDPFSQVGLLAASEAMSDAQLEDFEPLRAGVAVGAGFGGIYSVTQNYDKLKEHGPKRVSPFFVPAGIINALPGHISIKFGLKGPNLSIVTACTTGSHNIGMAARLIAYGDADVMLAGGSEMTTLPLCIAGFSAARTLSKRNDEPTRASRPWDKDRDGFVMSEGAGALVLESYEHAKARGAKIYAELAGVGMSADAYHITAPDEQGRGAAAAMNNAIKDANLIPSDIDYINAHGTSTTLNDMVETKAIKSVFKQHAYDLKVSSSKSMLGHLLGAAGAVEAIISILSIHDNVAPPTINLDNPDEGCDLNYVPHTAQYGPIKTALSNSLGFGGTNGALLFKSIE